MKIDDVIAAIKEFFLEVLGFLLPGFTLLLMSYPFLRSELKIGVDSFLQNEHSSMIILVVSYLLGYVLYGISDAWRSYKRVGKPDLIFRFLRFVRIIEAKPMIEEVQESIRESLEYKVSLEIIHEEIGIERNELEKMGVNSIRNLAMSYVSEVDRKIYIFMFRSELSDKVSIVLKIVFLVGICSWFIEKTTNHYCLFKADSASTFGYATVIVAAYFLRKTERRFFDIAMKLVFPIFVVKYKMQVDNKKQGNGNI